MLSPNIQSKQIDNERREGVIDESVGESPLSLDLEDIEIASIIGSRIENAERWWASNLDLDEVRKDNEKYYMNKSYSENDLYEWQIPYKNNRTFTAIETLIPQAVEQVPQPVVTESRDTDESRALAHDLGDVLYSLYEDCYVKSVFTVATRHLLMGKRGAVLKYYYDPDAGREMPDGTTEEGDVVVEAIRPEKIVIERESTDPDNISLIAEYKAATVEELIAMFPDKKDDIWKNQGIVKGTKSQLTRLVGYIEVWFTYFDKGGSKREAVAFKMDKDLILGGIKNPNWNYDEWKKDELTGKYISLNFFKKPKKPYIFITHLNTGRYVFDDTSLIEQAKTQQDILNKVGRQILENADQATSGTVFNSELVDEEAASKIIGDPTEKLMVKGDVNKAASRLPYNPLPAYVAQESDKARAEIDNIFGSNAALRGESTKDKTLGAMVLSQRANMGRLQPVTDSLEDAADRLYKGFVQLIKVFWDETQLVRFTNAEGNTRFINWNRDKIEAGVKVRVKAGSMLPKDKQATKNETIQLAPLLDPLSLAEGLDKPNPKEWAKRLVYYKYFMDKYLAEILGVDGDEVNIKALADIKAVADGQAPDVPDSPSQQYIATIDRFIQSDGFASIQSPEVKQSLIDFSKAVIAKVQSAMGDEPQNANPENTPEASGAVAPDGSTPPEGTPPVEPGGSGGGAPPVAPEEGKGNFLSKVVGLFKKK